MQSTILAHRKMVSPTVSDSCEEFHVLALTFDLSWQPAFRETLSSAEAASQF